MPRRRLHLLIRKSHRYLGVILGLQFLLWTIGGLYFSWSDIDEIHRDFQRNSRLIPGNFSILSPTSAVQMNSISYLTQFTSLQLFNILQRPFYGRYFTSQQLKSIIIDAETGKLLEPIRKSSSGRCKRKFH